VFTKRLLTYFAGATQVGLIKVILAALENVKSQKADTASNLETAVGECNAVFLLSERRFNGFN